MGRKVEINYSKVKEISDLGLNIKETLERLHECNINISRMQYYRWKQNNVTSNTNTKLSKKENYVTKNNVTSKGRYEVVGFGLEKITELKGKRFDTVEELTSIGVEEIFIYDYELGKCLSKEYVAKTKPFIPSTWR